MKINKWILAGCLSCLSLMAPAQNIMEEYNKPVNFGIRVGFNSVFPIIHSISIDEQDIDDYRMHYKVGYQAAVFLSINMNRFFIQPTFCWERSLAEVQFALPTHNNTATGNDFNLYKNNIEAEYNSLSIPVLAGYHLVKVGPYGLNVKAGPKGIYHYKKHQEGRSNQIEITHDNDNINYSINMVTAIGVTIGRLFLDFSYEFGLYNSKANFTYFNPTTNKKGNMLLVKRSNALSFSLGMVF